MKLYLWNSKVYIQEDASENVVSKYEPFWSGLIGPRKCSNDFTNMIFKHITEGRFSTHCVTALRWMPKILINDTATLVLVMAWCCQATSHYLSQCWPTSMSPYGIRNPQWLMTIPAAHLRSTDVPNQTTGHKSSNNLWHLSYMWCQ